MNGAVKNGTTFQSKTHTHTHTHLALTAYVNK